MADDNREPAQPNDSDLTREPAARHDDATHIGPYHLLQRIGEGGMGEVWIADQREPIRRTVAVKVIKVGMDTQQVVARFDVERQALAVMDHPAIAKVLDAGATAQRRPYFVMEYVKGEPITAYCDRHRLSTDDRLALFIRVCEGVQHAHQKGIIHRDLKPSNVLVALQDGQPVPKIIDFGIAKATAHHLTEQTVFTEMGVLIGTPEYMSPEQAEMTGLDVDTRSDIYALGVMLYELLTGTLPFDRKMLREKGLDEIRRAIREVDPPRPSTRITQLGPASTEAAKNRLTEPTRLAGQLRGDLDWITMKALDKDRTRRYGTASDLAADLRRHLVLQPVLASPPSTLYRARKFVRRHRVGVATAASLVVLLAAFAVTMAVQAQRIARERDRANREAAVARQISEFLVGMFRTSDPYYARGREVSAREVLDIGARRIQTELRGQPEVRTTLMATMAEVYYLFGVYDKAAGLAEEALAYRERVYGTDGVEVASSLQLLGAIKTQQGAYPEAERLLLKALDIHRKRFGDVSAQVASTLGALGTMRYANGDWPGAERVLREALAVRRQAQNSDDLELAEALNNLALVVEKLEKREESEGLYRESLALYRSYGGNSHPGVAACLNNIGLLYLNQGKYLQAEPLFEESLAINRKTLGDEHPMVATTLSNLAELCLKTDNLAKAEQYYRQALELDTKIFGGNSPTVADDLHLLGGLLIKRAKFPDAERVLNQSLQMKLTAFPPDHWQVAKTKNVLGGCLTDEGRYAEAEPLLTDSAAIIRRQFGPSHEATKVTTTRVVTLYERWGKPDKAAEWRKKLPPAK